MAIVEIIVSAACICKISRGSNTKIAVAFKQDQTGCGEFERDKWRVGNGKIGQGFAFLVSQVIRK